MRRIIVLGDIHIGDYPRYNNVVNRLGQFDRLADRLTQLEADDVIIAGDFLLSCVMKPKVMHAVQSFIKKLCTRFEHVYYILGNHDVDVKLARFSGEEDSLVTLFSDIPNFLYMHNKHVKIEDVDFYFMDWIKSHVVPLNETCDIFISHINLMPRFGQEVDNSKFKLGIFGDYHARFRIQNMMTTGTPIQHYVSDPHEAQVLMLNINGNTFNTNYISIENDEYQFLRIYKEDDYPRAPRELDVKVPTHKSEKIEGQLTELKSKMTDQLGEILENEGLTNIHKKVLASTTDIQPLDLDFKLRELHIYDFRSIEDSTIRFDDGKIVFLQGANGSGKSSFITALSVALFGDRLIKKHTMYGKNYTEASVELEYQGRVHKIIRATSYLGYWVNEVEQTANNKGGLQEMIEANLPFIPYLHDFIINSHTTFFGNCNRVALFSRLFGLDRYANYISTANKLKFDDETSRNKLQSQISINTASINTYNSAIAQEQSKINDRIISTTIESLEESLGKKEDTLRSIRTLDELISKYESQVRNTGLDINNLDDVSKLETEISLLKSRVTALSSINDDFKKLNSAKTQLESYKKMRNNSTYSKICSNCGEAVVFSLTSENVLSEITNYEKMVSELESKVGEYNQITINDEMSNLNKQITELNHRLDLTNKCISSINELNSNREKRSKITEDETSLKSDIEFYKNQITEIKIVEESKKSIDSFQASIDDLNNKNADLNNKIEELNASIAKYDKYLELFSVTNVNGIPYQTLNLIASSISDDEITFTTSKELASGKLKFSMSCQMNVDGHDIDFDELSDGQQAVVSLKILSKLSKVLPKIGLVILDEPLKHVDEQSVNGCINQLKEINANNVIISSHSPSFNYADRVIQFVLVDGVSQVTEIKD